MEECCFLHCQKCCIRRKVFLCSWTLLWSPGCYMVQTNAVHGSLLEGCSGLQPWALSESAEHFHTRVCSGSDVYLEHLKCASETKEANFRFHLILINLNAKRPLRSAASAGLSADVALSFPPACPFSCHIVRHQVTLIWSPAIIYLCFPCFGCQSAIAAAS